MLKCKYIIKLLHIVLLLSLRLIINAQSDYEFKYEIASITINTILKTLEASAFNLNKPKNLEIYTLHHPDSIYEIFDFETYEEKKIKGYKIDSLYFSDLSHKKEIYKKEIDLWNIKENLGKKVCFIKSFKSELLFSSNDRLNENINFRELLKRKPFTPFLWEKSKIINNTNYYLVDEFENGDKYKYAVAVHLYLSSVTLNEEMNKAIIQVGVHYMLGGNEIGHGSSGFGVILLFTKENNNWKNIYTYWLWDE